MHLAFKSCGLALNATMLYLIARLVRTVKLKRGATPLPQYLHFPQF